MTVLRDIPGYEGLYAVTEDGRVWSHARMKRHGFHAGRWLKPGQSASGYQSVVLHRGDGGKSVTVHRAVALAWLPLPTELRVEINHIDGVKTNNSASNLEWCTRSENQKHAHRIGLVTPKPVRFLTFAQAEMVRAMVRVGTKQKALAQLLGVSKYVIFDVVHNRNYSPRRSRNA